MCKVVNTIGSLKALKDGLNSNNIHDFSSLKEVINFRNSFSSLKQQLIEHHEKLISDEKEALEFDLEILQSNIQEQRKYYDDLIAIEQDKLNLQSEPEDDGKNYRLLWKIVKKIKKWQSKRKIVRAVRVLDMEAFTLVGSLEEEYRKKSDRYNFIKVNFQNAITQSAHIQLNELNRKKDVVDTLSSFIYGALGEQKVVKVLENLSDEFILINDFSVQFSPALYSKNENEYIKSVQIDHLLIGPSGVFLIETKNWSEKSQENIILRSPVEQIKRSSFALFKLLNNAINKSRISLDTHHWGDKKISIRNLIVLTNTKPREEFKFVKVLIVEELMSYINYFDKTYSNYESNAIAEYLIGINNTTIYSKK